MRYLLLIVVLLITYGSVYPFNFSSDNANSWAWQHFLNNWSLSTSRGDILGNVGLFFPFGLVALLALQRVNGLWVRIGLTLLSGFFLAFFLQAVQIYLPTRSAALTDVLWNLVGVSLGIVIALPLQKFDWTFQRNRLPDFVLPSCILIVWFLSELLPLVPSLDLQGIKDSIKPLIHNPRFSTVDAFFQLAGVLLFGRLLAEIVGESTAIRVLPALISLLLFGKVVVVTLVLDLSTCIGIILGYACWLVMSTWREPRRSKIVFFVLVSALSLSALTPFALRTEPAEFNWIPFGGLLEGSMLTNIQALADRLAIYSGLLWLLQALGVRLIPGSIALALLVGILETAQMLVQGRTATISEPLWVLIVATVMGQITRLVTATSSSDQHPGMRRTETSIIAFPLTSDNGQTPRSGITRLIGPLLQFSGACAVLAVLIAIVLRIPGIPYNVRELFIGEGSYVFLLGFSAALLWVGAGGYYVGHRLSKSRFPYLTLPVSVTVVSIFSLLLLSASVTQESIADIAGSNNLYWFVTNQGIWGSRAAALFTALDAPGLVGFFERPVRYTALYGPLVIFLGLMFAVTELDIDRAHMMRKTLLLVLSALPWLWLCKAIAFDWSSTDNLNELIARDGLYGWGGGGYLYILLAVTSIHAVALVRIPLRWGYMVSVVVFTGLAVSVGWLLLNLGLEQRIEKYGRVYSGTQFLLGPDRFRLLSEVELFLRWVVVYVSTVAIIATGSRLAQSFLEHWDVTTRRSNLTHGYARRSAMVNILD